MAISEATASGSVTLDQTTDTVITSMTLTPGAGDYLAVFTMEVTMSAVFPDVLTVSLFVNGSQVAQTERRIEAESSITPAPYVIGVSAKVSPGASQAVDVRYRVSSGASFTGRDRALTLIPFAAPDITEASSTTTDTTTSATYVAVAATGLTPAAGDYLAIFSCYHDAGADDTEMGFALAVGGTVRDDTQRFFYSEASLQVNEFTTMIAAKVSPNGSQEVDVRWRRLTGTGTLNCYHRKLTIVKLPTADIKETTATGTADGTGTSDEAIGSGLVVTAPGASDWLAIFTSSVQMAGSAVNRDHFWTLYANGSAVAATERNTQHEESIDDATVLTFTAGKVSPGSGDVEVKWRGGTSETRTARERTLVLVREAQGGASPPILIFSRRKAA